MSLSALDVGALRRVLAGRTFGDPLVYEERIGSTNDRALELAEEGYPEGTLVLCEEQTKGRGRRERIWLSPPRLGIYASLVLRPSLPSREVPLVTFASAVGVARALERRTGIGIRIKWPNDLVVSGRKVAGFLAEGRGSGPAPAAVVGLGLNVNHGEGDFSGALRDRATSLRIASGRIWDRATLLLDLLASWEVEHRALTVEGPGGVLSRWERLSAFRPGDRLRVDLGAKAHSGRYGGLGPVGELRLEEDDGTMRAVTFGEVHRVREE